MQAATIIRPGSIAVSDFDVPAPEAPDDVVVKVMASGVCGTDVHIYRGEYLGDYPIVPGHEFSGVVVATGSGVTRVVPGDRVAVEPNVSCDRCDACRRNEQNFCEQWQGIGVTRSGGMAQFVRAPERVVFSIGDIPYDRAAFMEPLSCVVHGIENIGVQIGDRVAVIGTGPIGMLLLRTARAWGATAFTAVDRNADRLARVGSEGSIDTVTELRELPSDRFDLVVDATGAPAVLPESIRIARPGGRVLMFGVAPQGATAVIEPFKVFRKGLTIAAAYTSRRNSDQALALIATGRVRVDDLISHRLPLAELEAGIQSVEGGRDGAMKVMIFPNPDEFR